MHDRRFICHDVHMGLQKPLTEEILPMLESEHIHHPIYKNKRCPYCFTHLRLDATHCIDCKKKVGKIDKFGLAKKPFNYKAYLASLLWIIMLGIYIWKVFFGRFLSDGG